MLQRCTGPPCPDCGCQDVHVYRWPDESNEQVWYVHYGTAICKHCNKTFTFKKAKAVIAPAIKHAIVDPLDTRAKHEVRDAITCKDCGITAKAYSTKGRTQYRKCPKCGNRFKTLKKGR